ncbi:SDR family oxidoreductase [Staphylococcus gallinarum]|uniref:SDR family NAD(P)-dependent oxidoreductase n=1 Tax=Staphylococcus gallinarum TaxID=1293 RepID=A0A418HP78_STAGA|nr:SDR family oxidoreductase [Staphylococcus gallinarum]MCD8826423.1 SDR family oxidoreductase [Staphylococcus gallinarum]MEB7038800.1 SDR family oxidoreductase [Staphylococcus gallinarum]PTE79652.1 D-mannonate oxidoreductase [Staphylococcus gallinarum]RIL43280.1 SDR family NAD(P)-dependent oxidoreductase [Staphylococcus gallinarum]RIO94789.1 SDR family NAD(P)-dependent oxidoreductase [Staphylococcus gallinarum]
MFSKHESLNQKVVVITGGSGVLCRTIAKELARQNMKIAILNRNFEKGKEIVDSIKNDGGVASNYAVDVTNEEDLIKAKLDILSDYGQIDHLINGAGGNNPAAITNEESYSTSDSKSFFKLEKSGFENVFNNNFIGSFLSSKIFGEELLKSQHSTIINFSSMSSYSPMTKVPAYSAAKAAINNFTQWLSVYFAEEDIRVNAIAPGFFLTEQNKDLLLNSDGSLTNRSQKILEHTPVNEFGKPEALVGTILWLLDYQYSSFVNGTTIPIDGGFMAYSGV